MKHWTGLIPALLALVLIFVAAFAGDALASNGRDRSPVVLERDVTTPEWCPVAFDRQAPVVVFVQPTMPAVQ